ncbi:hypothetical protein CGZ75_04995 [Paenibacillus herberti]|uniref:HTH araC/xylS-type domain-containing protein n=1 Tax=Paenibacillus herberti TaxID=1619309 RepID=A0A229P1H2_9BACL|nr:hypothetical protein CGZ75_04995 [Paenibacillus herberti]
MEALIFRCCVDAETALFQKCYRTWLFKDKFGEAPFAYFQRLKLEKAKCHLEQTNLSSTGIAEMLSIGSVQVFCKWFKKELEAPLCSIEGREGFYKFIPHARLDRAGAISL